MSVYDTPSDILERSIESVACQSHSGWELCICDDSSRARETIQLLDRYRGADPRIKIVRAPGTLGAAKAANLAAEFATGEYVALLGSHDTVEPNAVEVIQRAVDGDPEADVVYVDEDSIDDQGRRSEPYLKPDWSPERLLSSMYLGHFLIIRKALFLALDGLRDEYVGAHAYDLALRATSTARRVIHVPRVLYHAGQDADLAPAAKPVSPAALFNAKRTLADFVQRKVPGTTVVDGLLTGTYRVKWPIDENRPVTLLILTGGAAREIPGRGRIVLVENMVESIIERSSYRTYRLLVLDDGPLAPDIRDRFLRWGVTVENYQSDGPFNYSRKLNHAFNLVETEDVIVLNDDLEVIATDWIEALLQFSQQPEVGVVGAMLLYPDDRIQHAGVVLGLADPATHIFRNQPADAIGHRSCTHVIRNYSAVTGAVHATRMSIVREIGNFNTAMAIDYGDIDFCLRVRKAGYRIVYTPYAKLYHFEGSSFAQKEASKDKACFVQRWGRQIESDPYYNPGLRRGQVDCHIPGL